MKALAKFLPLVAGLALGFLVFGGPAGVIGDLGWAGYVLGVVLAAVLVLSAVGAAILANLPARVDATPVNAEDCSDGLRALAASMESLGFKHASGPLRVHLHPPVLVFPFVREEEGVYATVYETTGRTVKRGFDFVSSLGGGRVILTSAADPQAALLPLPAGYFCQTIPNAVPAELLDDHRKAIVYLQMRKIDPDPATARAFLPHLRASHERMRERFLEKPVRNTILVLYRVLARIHPCRGPLPLQAGLKARLAEVADAVARPLETSAQV